LCNNHFSDSQTIHYHNIIPPTLVWEQQPGLPGDTVVECSLIPNPPVLSAHDACGHPLTPRFNSTILSQSNCSNAYTIRRVWTVTDGCGLVSSHIQDVQVQDTTPPAIFNNPADTAYECGFVPLPPKVTATDNCPGVTLTFTEERHNGSNCCTYELTRKWVAVDECGLTTSAVQTITVRDHIPPVIHNVPPDTTVPCDGVPAVPTNVSGHEAPLNNGYCVHQTTDSCTPDSVPAEFSLTLPSQPTVAFTFDAANSIIVTVLNNQAWVYSVVRRVSDNVAFDLTLTFKDQTSNLAGVKSLKEQCYDSNNNPFVDSLSWTFFTNLHYYCL
jgi:hypothetical protein